MPVGASGHFFGRLTDGDRCVHKNTRNCLLCTKLSLYEMVLVRSDLTMFDVVTIIEVLECCAGRGWEEALHGQSLIDVHDR